MPDAQRTRGVRLQARVGDLRGVQRPGRGAEEIKHVEGERAERDGGHVPPGEGGQDGAEEVHAGLEEVQPGGDLPHSVRQTFRQPPVLRVEREPGQGGGVQPGGPVQTFLSLLLSGQTTPAEWEQREQQRESLQGRQQAGTKH